MSMREYHGGDFKVDQEVLDIAYPHRIGQSIPVPCDTDEVLGCKSSYAGHLVSLEGPNYDDEKGYGNVELVEKLLDQALHLEGPENPVREKVIEKRDELRDLGRKEHADQLDRALIGKGMAGKFDSTELEQQINPGNPVVRYSNGMNWVENDYSNFNSDYDEALDRLAERPANLRILEGKDPELEKLLGQSEA